MGSVFGGGGGGGGGPAPDTTTQFIREAPGIEERKLELMDLARSVAERPIDIPAVQIQQLSPLEQAAIGQAGQTGVGAGAVQQGIAGTQAAMQAPNIQQFYNPYQSYVLDEINRQSAMRQNQLAGQAVGAGAFGGARQGIQAAEEERARLGQIGQAQAAGFQTALSAAQAQQAREQSAAAQLANLGQVQQSMAGTDIQRQLQAGGLQRQLGQATLDAARQTQLQRGAEPLQRLEFLSNIYAAGPKSTSGITAATLPQSSPLAQSIGTGLGVAQAYQNVSSNPAINTGASVVQRKEGGIIDVAEIRKLSTGGPANKEEDLDDEVMKMDLGSGGGISKLDRSNMLMTPIISQLLQARQRPGQSGLSATAEAVGKGLEEQLPVRQDLAKFDQALEIAKAKAKPSSATSIMRMTGAELGTGDRDDIYFAEVDASGNVVKQPKIAYDISEEKGKIAKAFKDRGVTVVDNALRDLETLIEREGRKSPGDLPGLGKAGGRVPDILTSTAGKQLRARLARFGNILLKERSGAAVTESELNRFLKELSEGETGSETALLASLANARNALEKEKLAVVGQFKGEQAVKRYILDKGIKFYTPGRYASGQIATGGLQQDQAFNFLERDGKQITFIGGILHELDPKTGELIPRAKKPPKKKGK